MDSGGKAQSWNTENDLMVDVAIVHFMRNLSCSLFTYSKLHNYISMILNDLQLWKTEFSCLTMQINIWAFAWSLVYLPCNL